MESSEQTTERGNRKTRKGLVVSNKMQKTVVVKVERTIRHPQYGKVVQRAKKYYAHHEGEPLAIGSEVTIRETRPLSKLKRWLVVAE
jgi:small subunit ribosomal protein S17